MFVKAPNMEYEQPNAKEHSTGLILIHWKEYKADFDQIKRLKLRDIFLAKRNGHKISDEDKDILFILWTQNLISHGWIFTLEQSHRWQASQCWLKLQKSWRWRQSSSQAAWHAYSPPANQYYTHKFSKSAFAHCSIIAHPSVRNSLQSYKPAL